MASGHIVAPSTEQEKSEQVELQFLILAELYLDTGAKTKQKCNSFFNNTLILHPQRVAHQKTSSKNDFSLRKRSAESKRRQECSAQLKQINQFNPNYCV